MIKRILVLSASAGAGHVRAGQALEAAIGQAGAAAEVRHLDTLEYTNAVFRRLYAQAYLDLVNKSPTLLGWLYDYMDEPFKDERKRLAWSKLNTRPFIKLLEQYPPDIALCTHFLPAEIISWLKDKGRIHCPLAVVVTDLDVHSMWLCRNCDHYFVALEETRQHLLALGVPEEKVSTTGIPIDPAFAQSVDPRAARVSLGLDPDLTTILVSAGGFGVGPIEHLFTELTHLKHPAQVVAICGRNEALRTRLTELAGLANTPARIQVVGFTTQMQQYMSAADILVGKPGGLTTSEALAKGLAMVIVNPIPGQEERNSDHLLEEGAAIRCNNLPVLAYKVDALLADPPRLARLRENARRLGRPHSAAAIVGKLASLTPAAVETRCRSIP